MTDLPTPATLAAEFSAPCRDNTRHRIWVHRDGSVTTPDHPTSDPENVAHALGHVPSHPCARFTAAADHTNHRDPHRGTNNPTTPDVTNWVITRTLLWTAAACWTSNTALTGVAFYDTIAPTRTLAYLHTYQCHDATPRDLPTHLRYLAAPWTRPTGWRRDTAVEPEELRDILTAGIPGERAASALALGLTAGTVRELRARLTGDTTHATETLLMLAHAIAPRDALRHIPTDRTLSMQDLTHNCQQLKHRLDAGEVSDADIPRILFPAAALSH